MRHLDLSLPYVWLLTLDWPEGRPLRLSSRPVAVAGQSGDLQYQGGLPPLRWRWEVPLMDASVGGAGFSVEVDPGLDLELAAAAPLEGRQVELALHLVGEPYAARRRLLDGLVARATLGIGGQLAALEVAERTYDDQGALVDADDQLNTTDYPDLQDDAAGQQHVVVVGAPGGGVRTADGDVVRVGSPAWVVRRTAGVPTDPITTEIAGHHVAAENVTIYNATTGGSYLRAVTNTALGEGSTRRQVATVNLHPVTDFGAATADDQYYVTWEFGGGLMTADRGRALDGAGELLDEVLRRFSSLRVDRGRLAALGHGAERVDSYVNDAITAWDWVRQALLPLAPYSMGSGPDGVHAVAWALVPEPEAVVLHLEVGRNCTRASMDEPADLDLCTRASVRFGVDDVSGEYARTITVGDAEPETADEGSSSWAWRELEQVAVSAEDLDQVQDADTAWLLALRRVQLGHRSYRALELDLDPELAGVEVGDQVTITDAGRGWTRRAAQVLAAEIAGAYVRAAVLVQVP